MADGSITFSTALDNEQLEKDLKRTEKEIDGLKRKIEEGKDEESFAERQMEAAKEATEEARQAVKELREELGVADDGALAASLRDANREVADLESRIAKNGTAKTSIEEQMDQGGAAVARTEEKVRELTARLQELENVDPTDMWEWHRAQGEITGVQQALDEANAKLQKQIEEQDALGDKWQVLDEKAGEYATKLEEASARQGELSDKNARLSEANAALKEQTKEQDRLTKKWRSTNEQTEKYTRQLERAQQRQKELGAEYAKAYSKASATICTGIDNASSALDKFTSRIGTMLKRVFVFGVILKGVRAISDALTGALAQNDRFSASWENLKATVAGVANAIANLVEPAITGMVNAATAAITTLARTIDGLFGTGIMQAIQSARAAAEANWRQTEESKAAQKAIDKQAKSAKKLAKAEEKATKSILAFDEINALQAQNANDAADALGDEADGLVDPSTLMKPDWEAFDVGKIDAKLAEIMLIIGAALMAIGAVLAFSGINIPLGITLMVIGALMVYTAYKEQWDKLSQEVREAITTALVITGIVLVVLGAVLCFSGVNIPLGIGMMAAGALMLWTAVALNWESMPEEIRDVVTVLMGILSVALIVVGAILTFSGANVPLGIALMVAGAVSLSAVAAINWERMPEEIRNVVAVIAGILGTALLVVGAILALSGVNLPLGIGLMAVGAVMLAADAALNWDAIQENLNTVIPLIEAAVGAALLVVGAVLAFSGANVPLGLGLMSVGAVTLGTAITENWDTLPEEVKGAIAVIEAAVGAAALVVGAVLCFSGVNTPLGIALLAGGALAMGHALTENWDLIPDEIKGAVATIELALGTAFLAIGAALTFSGANVPLGLGLLAIGALAMGHALTENWNEIPEEVRSSVVLIESIVAPALLVIGAVLTFSGANIPLGIALLAGGALMLVHLATLNWNEMPESVRSTVTTILGIVGGALVVLGIILCVTGVALPIGIACIAAGAASLVAAAAINWDFIVDKVREVWDKVKQFYHDNIEPCLTWEFWANVFKGIVNGLIEQINNGLQAFGGFLNDLAGGVGDILNFFGVQGWSFSIGMPQIPYLAQGAVIPPNREFLAVLGDQKSGNNIEAPEGLLRQVVREEVGPMLAEAILALSSQGGGDVSLVLKVDSEELSRAVSRGTASRVRRGDLVPDVELAFGL